MAETTEYLTLINCTGKLETALQSDRELAQFLNQEGFITDEVYTDVTNTTSMQTPLQKAGTLIACIKNKVKLNSSRYHRFVYYLRQNKRRYEDIVSILDKEYNKILCCSQDDHGDVSQIDAVGVLPQPIDVPRQGGMWCACLYNIVYDTLFLCRFQTHKINQPSR